MAEDFVDMCAVCKSGVPRESMVYQKGRVFHQQCFNDHGSKFPAPDKELDSLSAKTRIELVLLKNLKAREELEKTQKKPSKAKKAPAKKAAKKRPAKKSAKKPSRKAKPKAKRPSAKRTKKSKAKKSKSASKKRRR